VVAGGFAYPGGQEGIEVAGFCMRQSVFFGGGAAFFIRWWCPEFVQINWNNIVDDAGGTNQQEPLSPGSCARAVWNFGSLGTTALAALDGAIPLVDLLPYIQSALENTRTVELSHLPPCQTSSRP
jgi:hypothetical protein